MRQNLILFIALVLFSVAAMAQSTANYTFSTAANGSLTDMSSGTTTLLSSGIDDNASAVTNIGFTFIYMGSAYTQFTVSDNGIMRLGSTAISTGQYSIPSTTVPLLSVFGNDMRTGTDGSVLYKVTGSAPNRVLVVQWKNNMIRYLSSAAAGTGTFEMRLYESTGVIEYVYGSMQTNSASPTVYYVGFSNNTTANTLVTVNTSTHTASTSATVTSNSYSASSTITSLHSTSDGTRRIYTFTPPAAPTAPTSLSFTSVSSSSMTLNWVDSPDELSYSILRSTDGVNYSVVATPAANSITYVASGLVPGTTYYWQVLAVNEGRSSSLSGNQATNPPGSIASIASGNWSATSTWAGGAVPTATDNVTIADGHTVVIDAAANAYNLTVGQGTSGILRYGTTVVALTVNNNLTVAAGGSFEAGAAGGASLTHTLNIGGSTSTSTGGGNLTVNGIFDMYIGASNGKANTVFYGVNDAAISGTGGTLDFNTITLNKGAVTANASVTPPVLDIQRAFTSAGSATTAILSSFTAGVLKISGTFTQTNPIFTSSSYTIPSTGGLWLTNPNFTISGVSGSPTLSGLLKIQDGTYNIGTASGNSMGFSSNSIIRIDGGTINAAGRFGVGSAANTINYAQTGGIINVQTVGNTSTTLGGFDAGTSTSTIFNMSGGSINLVLASTAASGPRDFRGPSTSAAGVTITGGTLNLGTSASGAAKTYYVQAVAPNFVITNTSANHNATFAGNLTIMGDLTVNGTGIFNQSSGYTLNMKGQSVANPGNIVNNGTLTLSTSDGNVLSFTSSFGNQSLTNNGTITGSQIPQLVIANTFSGGTVTLPSGIIVKPSNIYTGLTLTSGQLIAPSLTLGNGGTSGFKIAANGGSISAAPTFNPGTGTLSVTYGGSSAQVTSYELPSTMSGTLTINNTAGVSLGSPVTVGTLTLTAGALTTTATNIVTVSGTTASSVTRTSGYVNGPMERTVAANQTAAITLTYPLAKSASTYRPLDLVNPITGAGGTTVVRAEVFDQNSGGTAGTNMQSINTNRYWSTSITSGSENFVSTSVKLTEDGMNENSGIAKSATQTGAYDYANSSTPVSGAITSGTLTSLGYLVIGTKSLPMAYSSSTTTQTVTTPVIAGSTNQQIIGLQVVTVGNASALNATAITLNTSGTTSEANISKVKVWYTGSSSTFATTTQFGTDYDAPTGEYTIEGSQALVEGTNYFWVTYDVALASTEGNVLDAECISITTGVTPNSPTVSAPTGSRPIYVPLSGAISVGTGQTYTTLTATGGLFEAINSHGLQGNATVSIVSDLTETGATALNQWSEINGSGYTLTISPDAAAMRTISGNYSGGLIRLNGADRVTFDGRFSGAGSYLTIQNTATSGTVAAVQVISLGTGAGATNNTIRNSVIKANFITSGAYAVSIGGTTVGTAADDNDNFSFINNTVSKAYYGIYANATATGALDGLTITGNIIGSNTSTEYIMYRGMYIGFATAPLISQNTVFNILQTAGVTIAAIDLTAGITNAIVSQNKLYGLMSSSSSGWGAFGINLDGSTSTGNILVNNVIYNVYTANYSTTSTGYNAFGIRLNNGSNTKVYFNSINMYGTVTTGTAAGMSAALVVTSTNVTGADVRNNIFANSTAFSVVGSKSYAVYVESGVTFGTINYNNYYTSGTYGIFGYYGSEVTTLSAWRTASAGDVNSFTGTPAFSANNDLRPGLGSVVINSGTPISGYTTDYLGTTRNASNPTVGAYEEGVDVSGPTITYTTLGNTTSTSNRNITVTITDPSGVNTTVGTAPRLYFRRSTDADTYNDNTNTTDGWKYVEASNGTSPFNFSIDYSLLNGGTGVAVGSSLKYFVVAQDNQGSPYISINSGTFATAPASVALSAANFPIGGTVNGYTITLAVSGTFNVGTGQTYTTLTATGGLFEAINNGTVTGNITVNIVSDITETGAVALNQWFEEPASSNFTLKIQPDAAVTRTVSGSYAGGLIRLNGADRVTIDGRYSGSGNYLTFVNNSTSASAVIQMISLGASAGSTNNTVRNCNIQAGAITTANVYGINVGGSTFESTGADNDHVTITENVITKAYVGIYAYGASSGVNNGLIITNNTIGSTNSLTYIGHDGIMVSYADGALIKNNTIQNIITSATTPVGITITTGVVSSEVLANKITSVRYSGSGGYGGRGIYVAPASASSSLTIANNLIADIGGDGYTSFSNSSMVGIYVDATSGGINLYYNSVYLRGQVSRANNIITAAMLLNSSTITAVNLKNNIFVNSILNTSSSGTTSKAYAIYSSAPNTAFSSIDYNDYYVAGVQGVLGYLGSDITTLSGWQTATGQDVHSISGSPLFNDTTNFNLQPVLGAPVLAAGTPIVGVTTDYLGITRSVTAPSMGGYENGGDGAPPVFSYTVLGNTTQTTNRTISVTITDVLSNVNTTTAKPRVYFKKSSDASVFGGNTSTDNGWKWVETSSSSSPFSFTIDYSIINGGSVTGTDIVQYFFVAQDDATSINVGASPSSGFVGTSVSAITAAPSTPNSYKIVGAPLAGTYSVGLVAFNRATGKNLQAVTSKRTVTREVASPVVISTREELQKLVQNKVAIDAKFEFQTEFASSHESPFVDLKTEIVEEEVTEVFEAGRLYTGPSFAELTAIDGKSPKGAYTTLTAALADLNERGLSAPVILSLTDNTYSSETYPLVVSISSESMTSSTNTVTIKPAASATPVFSGSSSNGPLFKIASSYVTIDGSNTNGGTTRDLTLTNTSTTAPNVLAIVSTGTTTITDVAVKNAVLTNGINTSSAIIVSDGSTIGNAGYFNNITLQNNSIKKAYNGIYARGGDAGAANGTNLTISGNDLASSGTDAIKLTGIYVQGVSGAIVSGNTIANFESTSSENDKGIWLATGTINSVVTGNNIQTLGYTGTSGYGGYGIAVSAGVLNANIVIANNMISKIVGDGYDYASYFSDNPMGMYIYSTQSGVKVYYNSINLTGSSVTQTSGFSSGISLGTGTVAEIKNNIIQNNLGVASGSLASIGVFAVTDNSQISAIDYNNYVVAGSTSGAKYLARIGTSNASNITELRAMTGSDVNSVSQAITFASTTDAHLSGASLGAKALTGTPISGYTTDIDGNTRNTYFPYMGADENTTYLLGARFTVKAFFEGLFDGSAMVIADTAKVYLHSIASGSMYAPVDSAVTAVFGTDGNATINFVKGDLRADSTYYLVVKHRNSVETWSANPLAVNTPVVNYDFTTAASQAYGDNQVLVGTSYCFYAGEVNNDYFIELSDVVDVYNAYLEDPATDPRYVIQDINGDGYVDLSDVVLTYNNYLPSIYSINPISDLGKSLGKSVRIQKISHEVEKGTN